MAERVRRDPTDHIFAEKLLYALFDDVAPGGGRDGLDLFAGAFVVTGEEGQGGKLPPGTSI